MSLASALGSAETRPAAYRPLQVPRPRALIVPWQSAAVPIPPGAPISPTSNWRSCSCRVGVAPFSSFRFSWSGPSSHLPGHRSPRACDDQPTCPPLLNILRGAQVPVVLVYVSSQSVSRNNRPDRALRDQFGRLCVIVDVRTAMVSVDGTCIGAAATPGHAAACGVILKDAKWVPQAVAQGLVHFSLVIEDGWTLSPAISNFIVGKHESI